jgi:hypothetical protein
MSKGSKSVAKESVVSIYTSDSGATAATAVRILRRRLEHATRVLLV